jgi:hypothetical protein
VQLFTDKTKATAALATYAPAGTVLYQADWSTGLTGWSSMDGWKALNGQLLNDGTGGEQLEAAPINLSAVADYAVEADIQVVRNPGGYNFGLFARDASYYASVDDYDFFGHHNAILSDKDGDLASKGFDPGGDKHTYRLEVKGNTMQLLIDGTVVVQTTDNKYLDGGKNGQVGLRCKQAQLVVTGFRVIKL